MIYDGFEDWKDVLSAFETTASDKIVPLYACYNQQDYEGSAFVLFLEDEKLYGVYGSHCSCMGLEDQWDPEFIEWECAVEYLTKSWHVDDKDRKVVLPYIETLATSTDRGKDIGELRTFVTLKYADAIH